MNVELDSFYIFAPALTNLEIYYMGDIVLYVMIGLILAAAFYGIFNKYK